MKTAIARKKLRNEYFLCFFYDRSRSMQDFPKFPIAFGGAAVSGEGMGYGFGQIDEKTSIKLLQKAYESGIEVFDTAPIYGFGLSEKRIGKALKSVREKVFYVSKSGVTWDQNQRVDINNDPKICQKMLETSLKDLETDCIDLYMIHWPDPRIDIRKSMEYLSRAKENGKIRYIGLCNTNVDDFNKASEIDGINAIQDVWNAFTWKHTMDRYEFLKDKKIYKMGYGTFDKGILTGRVDENRKFEREDCRSWAPWWKKINKKRKFELVKELQEVLHKYEISLRDFALQFSLVKENFLDVALVGFRSIEQLDTGLKSLKNKIDKKVMQEIMLEWMDRGYRADEEY